MNCHGSSSFLVLAWFITCPPHILPRSLHLREGARFPDRKVEELKVPDEGRQQRRAIHRSQWVKGQSPNETPGHLARLRALGSERLQSHRQSGGGRRPASSMKPTTVGTAQCKDLPGITQALNSVSSTSPSYRDGHQTLTIREAGLHVPVF
jgi:hypothetical protein